MSKKRFAEKVKIEAVKKPPSATKVSSKPRGDSDRSSMLIKTG